MMYQGIGEVGRHNPLHALTIVCLSHLGFASICLIRPNLNMIYVTYAPFGNLTPWGFALLLLVVALWFAPRASFWLMLAELTSAFVLFTIAVLLTMGGGLLPTVASGPAVLGCVSLLLFGRTVGGWLGFQEWYLDLMVTPPEFIRRTRLFKKLRRIYGPNDG